MELSSDWDWEREWGLEVNGGGVGGPCDFSVSPRPFGLDFGTLDSDFGLGLDNCHKGTTDKNSLFLNVLVLYFTSYYLPCCNSVKSIVIIRSMICCPWHTSRHKENRKKIDRITN